MVTGMTKRKATITVDPEKAAEANRLLGSSNFSLTVERALDLLIRHEQGRRDLEAYERQPLTTDEAGPAHDRLVGDPTDDTDWAALYPEAS
jgi:hypothetical protein